MQFLTHEKTMIISLHFFYFPEFLQVKTYKIKNINHDLSSSPFKEIICKNEFIYSHI